MSLETRANATISHGVLQRGYDHDTPRASVSSGFSGAEISRSQKRLLLL